MSFRWHLPVLTVAMLVSFGVAGQSTGGGRRSARPSSPTRPPDAAIVRVEIPNLRADAPRPQKPANSGAILLKAAVVVTGPPRRTVSLRRKRFYLFRGGLDANKALLDKLESATFISRDCFYCGLKPKPASSQFMAWLRQGDCETPFCRAVTETDIGGVPEFQTAYQKGASQWRQKPNLATEWLVTNLLPKELREGFFDARKAEINGVLKGLPPPMATLLTDSSSAGRFLDIDLGADTKAKFLVTNLSPIDLGDRSIILACEKEVSANASAAATISLSLPAPRSCREIIAKPAPGCTGNVCQGGG